MGVYAEFESNLDLKTISVLSLLAPHQPEICTWGLAQSSLI